MVVPILLLIVGGIVDFAMMLRRTEVVVNAAREGARIAVLPGYNQADVIARVNAYLNEGIEAGASANATTALNPATVAVATGPAVQALQVVVQYQTSYPILGPLMNEAAYVLSEGVPVEEIDGAFVDWGFPVGPITLLDEVGIDVAEKVGHIMHAAFGDRMTAPPGFEKLIADGRQGRKNEKGFYRYGGEKKGKKKKVDESVYAVLGVEPNKRLPNDEIAQRCALQMVNEAAHCLGEGILSNPRDGDIGAVFGLGFPPFRGGPFRYIDAVGVTEIVRRLRSYESALGTRFTPAPILVDMANNGKTFY